MSNQYKWIFYHFIVYLLCIDNIQQYNLNHQVMIFMEFIIWILINRLCFGCIILYDDSKGSVSYHATSHGRRAMNRICARSLMWRCVSLVIINIFRIFIFISQVTRIIRFLFYFIFVMFFVIFCLNWFSWMIFLV